MMPHAENGMRNATCCRMPRPVRTVAYVAGTLFVLLAGQPALAGTKDIEAEHLYLMGENDSRIEARRICTQEAQRKALALAGTFLASLTEVKEFRLTRDEVTAYTAGIVETQVVAEEMRGTVQHPELFIKVRCQIDTSVLRSQIENYRENDDLKAQLDGVVRENEALRKERDALLAKINAEPDRARADEARKQLDRVLTREEANDETMQYWNRLAHRLMDRDQMIDAAELTDATTALARLAKQDPGNSRARLLLASIHQRQGDLRAAEAEVRGALAQSPDDPLLHLKLGALLKQGRQYNAALAELQTAEQGLPDHPHVLFHLATTYMHLDQCSRATGYARRFQERVQRRDKPVGRIMQQAARRVLADCNRGELEPPRRRR